MNGKQHFFLFLFVWSGLLIWRLIIQDVNWMIFKGLWFGFIVTNPDIDLLLQKMTIQIKKVKGKLKIGKKGLHRWGFTHSILYPLFLYWLIKDFEILNAKEFGLILFLPVLIHLLGDFQIRKLLNEDKMDTTGTWRIYLFGKRLSPVLSYLWMIANVIAVAGYIYWIYF